MLNMNLERKEDPFMSLLLAISEPFPNKTLYCSHGVIFAMFPTNNYDVFFREGEFSLMLVLTSSLLLIPW